LSSGGYSGINNQMSQEQICPFHICAEIIKKRLYKQMDGGDPFPEQIFLRARKHSEWFEVIDKETISLLNNLSFCHLTLIRPPDVKSKVTP
jgi:hypothetical protein